MQIAFEHEFCHNRPKRLYRVTSLHDFGDNKPTNDFRFTDYFTNKANATKRLEQLKAQGIEAVVVAYAASGEPGERG